MFTKDSVIGLYDQNEVLTQIENRESALQSLNDPKLKELDETITYLLRRDLDLVNEALQSLRRKKDSIVRPTENLLARRLELIGFAQVTNPDNPGLDLLLPIQPHNAERSIGKALFSHVSTVLDRHGTWEVTDYHGYVNIITNPIGYQNIDMALLELSVDSPELASYNTVFGIARLYSHLSEMPTYTIAPVSQGVPEQPVRRRGRPRKDESAIPLPVLEEKEYFNDYLNIINEVGDQEGYLTPDEGEDIVTIRSRLEETAAFYGKKLDIRQEGNEIYFRVLQSPRTIEKVGRRGRPPSPIYGQIESYIDEHGATSADDLIKYFKNEKAVTIRNVLSKMSGDGRLLHAGRNYSLPRSN